MGAAVSVRAYRAEDAPALILLAAEMAADLQDPPPSNTPALLAEVALSADPWCRILVAERGGAVVGFAVTCRHFEAHIGQRSLFLADLHVARAARRGGVATALMAAVGREAAAQRCAKVVWTLWTRNTWARAFYDRIGATVDVELKVVTATSASLASLT